MGLHVFSGLGRQLVRDRITDFVRPYATTAKVLDLGCGNSPYSALFPNRLCVDIRRRPGAAVVGDAHRLPFAANSFDLILCTEMLEHTLEPQRVIDQVQRILRPGGRVLLTTRFIFPLHDVPGDYFRFTNYALAHLFRAWSSVDVRPETTSWETFGVILQRVAFQCEFRAQRVTRAALLVGARLVRWFGPLVTSQYGNIGRTEPVADILVSGWHVTAIK